MIKLTIGKWQKSIIYAIHPGWKLQACALQLIRVQFTVLQNCNKVEFLVMVMLMAAFNSIIIMIIMVVIIVIIMIMVIIMVMLAA